MDGARSGKRGEPTPSFRSEELDAILRSIAHAPPRRVPLDPAAGVPWGASGRYVVERRLGRGGMGTVYLASDTLLGRRVALKVLDRGEADETAGDRARLLREARLAARLEHERVARVYDVGEHEGDAFVAMEYVRGVTLRARMAEGSPAPAEVVAILVQIAEGLEVLHASGVVHRDLKPENVMLPASGGMKLLDFGLARRVRRASGPEPVAAAAPSPTPAREDALMTPEECLAETVDARVSSLAPVAKLPSATSSDDDGAASLAMSAGSNVAAFLGTPGYMAPEQCLAEPVDSRADVFALGVIVFELVTGRRPFQGTTLPEILRATLEDAPAFDEAEWDRFPRGLRGLAGRMLEHEPGDRFADGADVARALKALSLSPAPPRLPARTRAVLVVSALAAAAATATGIRVAQVASARRHAPPIPPPHGMVRIAEGALTVGRPAADLDRQCAEIGATCDRAILAMQAPEARVTVLPFAIDAREVDNRAMAETLNTLRASFHVVEDEDHHIPRYVRFNSELGVAGDFVIDLYPGAIGIEYVDQEYRVRPGFEDLPVVQVTWHGASLFCEQHGKRLPTEDEWEAAARGTANRTFPWGEGPARCGKVALAGDGAVPLAGWCPGEGKVLPVGTATDDVTPDGVLDLGGNVAEWVASAYFDGSRGVATDSPGPLHARVFRGGSFIHSVMARTSVRNRRMPNAVGDNLGFRCAVSERQ